MTKESIVWSINSDNQFSLIDQTYQGPNFFGDQHLTDLSVSAEDMIFVLVLNPDGTSHIEYSKQTFPFGWDTFYVTLSEELFIRKIDAGPNSKVYMVLSDNTVGWVPKPNEEKSKDLIQPTIIPDTSLALEISVGSDGTVWIVASDNEGSVVKWYDEKKKVWNTIPEMINAQKVTGHPDGKVMVITSGHEMFIYDKKGKKTTVPAEFKGLELSMAPDKTLWAISEEMQMGGGKVYWTSDEGKIWNEVPNASATLIDAGNAPKQQVAV